MLGYLETVGRLTDLRDNIRAGLERETGDRQIMLERVETNLTTLLGELVTPSETCALCEDGNRSPAVGVTTETGEGVCQKHIFVALLQGHAINTSAEAVANLRI